MQCRPSHVGHVATNALFVSTFIRIGVCINTGFVFHLADGYGGEHNMNQLKGISRPRIFKMRKHKSTMCGTKLETHTSINEKICRYKLISCKEKWSSLRFRFKLQRIHLRPCNLCDNKTIYKVAINIPGGAVLSYIVYRDISWMCDFWWIPSDTTE